MKFPILALALLVAAASLSQAQDLNHKRNTLSPVQFRVMNNGIYAYNRETNSAELYWPRGSQNIYLFAAGIWFGAKKQNPSAPGELRDYVEVSYNPNTGKSWMSPGRIEEKPGTDSSILSKKYQVHRSTDFRTDGSPFNADSEMVWPVWRSGRPFGEYVHDPAQRSSAVFVQGPAFISHEDITTVFKDTDLSRYEPGAAQAKAYGYPLRLQYEQNIYSWREGHVLQDAIAVRYKIINFSQDTLRDCWIAQLLDTDIALSVNPQVSIDNDRLRYVQEHDSLVMAIGWTEGNRGEAGQGFGYLGATLLESPAVDNAGFIRRDKASYPLSEQLGLRTFRNWAISDDFQTEAARYAVLSSGEKEGDMGPGDRCMLLATGPFTMRPGDTTVLAIGIVFALPSSGAEATGATSDLAGLVTKVRTLRNYYLSGISVTSVDEMAHEGLEASVIPQPASSSATVIINSADEKNISVVLYSSLGERIATVYEGMISNETKFLPVDTGALPSGLYFIRISGRQSIPLRVVH